MSMYSEVTILFPYFVLVLICDFCSNLMDNDYEGLFDIFVPKTKKLQLTKFLTEC